jgi:glycosyltransferase involved in cell wall biosynthesis
LGIFGDSLKADLVIPNKIFHYAACRKPIITKDSVGIREIFTHEQSALLTSIKQEQIAEAILRMKKNEAFANQLANRGYEIVTSAYNSTQIAQKLLNTLP